MTAQLTMDEIMAKLDWSKPRQVPTKRGPRLVSSAKPNNDVFALFEREKDALYKAGYTISQFRGAWQVSRWVELPAEAIAKIEEAKALSRATDAEIEIPVPQGLSYLGYQKAGIKYAFDRPATLIGCEMGLGKTVQAIGVLNLMPDAKRIVVVCPASLKLNWQRELSRWSVIKRPIYIADGKTFPDLDGIVIVNYDVLHKHRQKMLRIEWDLVVCDEAHYLKNPKSRRAKMVFGTRATKEEKKDGMADVPGIVAKKRLLLTGTPIANRPVEIFPLIEYLDPETWGGNFFKFAIRYCNAHRNGFGWDFTGASHLDELQDKLRATIMVRRLKKDVLTELPPKRRQVIEFAAEGELERFAEAERHAYDEREDEMAGLHAAVEIAKASDVVGEYETAVENLRKGIAAIFGSISTMRRELAEAKTDLCIEHLQGVLEETDKVVVFAHHKTVVARILAAFPGEIVSIVGDTAMADRQAAVDRFQKDPTCKLIIGSFGAMGVGHTLTAAAHVVCCELDWVPGNVSQAEDRCHRIGQKNSVLVQHLVVEGSLDATIAKRIVSKQNVIDDALDEVRAKIEAEPLDLGARKDRGGETVGTPRDQIAKDAETITDDQRKAVHAALKMIAGRCNGARDWDGAGFSKIDTRLGKDLAEREWLSPKQAALGRRILRKYAKTQLYPALVEAMGLGGAS